MNDQNALNISIMSASIPVLTLLLAATSFAEVYPLRVAFENVPGVEEIEAGNLQAGIVQLEDQLEQAEQESKGDILASLCAAYILNHSLTKAERICDKAVQAEPTRTAYNNRGVLRAFKGDMIGAQADFERARPRQLDAYLEELRKKDIGLIAANNHELIEALAARHTPAEIDDSVAIASAVSESFGD